MSIPEGSPAQRSGNPLVPNWLVQMGGWAWRLVAIGTAVIGLWFVFRKLRPIEVPVVLAVFAAAVLDPPVRWLEKHGVPRLLATWITFLVAGGIIATLVMVLLPGVENEAGPLGNDLTLAVKRSTHWLEHGPLHLSKADVQHYIKEARDLVTSHGGTLATGLAHGLATALGVVTTMVLSLVLCFLFVSGGERIGRTFLAVMGGDSARHHFWRRIGRTCWQTLSGYVLGTTANGLVNALLMSIGLVILRVPLVLPIAVLTFVGAYLPLVGAFVAGGIAALVALAAHGVVSACLVAVVVLIVHAAEGYLVGPQVLGRSVHLTPVSVVLALAIGDTLVGVEGAFIAVPVAAVGSAVFRALRHHDPGEEAKVSGDADQPAPQQAALTFPG